MVQYGRPRRSSWAESVRSSLGRTILGKAIWANPICSTAGRIFQIGNAYSYIVKKGYSYLCMWMTSNWLERNKTLIRCYNLLKALSQHASQSGMITKLGFLKSGKLTNRWTFWRRTHDGAGQSVVNEEELHDRTGQPVVIPQRKIGPQQFLIGNDEAELELSLGSRSFSKRVSDQMRKRRKRSSMNVTEDG